MSDAAAPDVRPAYTTKQVGRLFLARWERTPSAAANRALLLDMAAARRTTDAPLVVLIVLTEQSGVPPLGDRAEIQRQNQIVDRVCSSLHFFIEGDAFVRRLVRALVVVVTFVLRTDARFHDTLADALAAACRDLALDAESVRAEAMPFLRGDAR